MAFLSLDNGSMRQNFASVGNEEALMLFASFRLNRALADKYGPPLDSQSDCAADVATLAKRPIACTINCTTPPSPSNSTGSPVCHAC